MGHDKVDAPIPTIGRLHYFLAGFGLLVLKHNLDRFVASAFFGKSWGFFNYIVPPAPGASLLHLSGEDRRFYGTLLLLAVPFIVVGVSLTLRRLRSAGLPPSLVVLFFVPIINLGLFLLLSALPSRASQARRDRRGLAHLVPEGALGSALCGVALALMLGFSVVVLGVQVFARYGWGLFVGVPFSMGLFAALVHGYRTPRGLGECLGVSLLAPLLLAALLLGLAVEGFVCIAMAGPLAALLSGFGGLVGYLMQKRAGAVVSPQALVAVALSAPLLMGAEQAMAPEAPLFEVATAEEVDAPPEIVWPHAVAVSELPPPREWIFRLGIAYPLRATIDGEGPGALRHCVFTTGEFLEPITIWDPPRRLAFGVRAQPAPMQEWTPFADVHPPHLDGYLRSERGEFRLRPLPGGRTRLEGSTFYRHDLWPSAYWRAWSDAIIHRIHSRVLRHVRAKSEAAESSGRVN